MEKFIWIRHAEKEYNNGKSPDGLFQHDSPIKKDKDDVIFQKVNTLYEKFGFPTKIIYSPFLRTRQTKDMMLKKLEKIDPLKASSIIFEADLNISEYLGFQKPFGIMADVDSVTLSYFKDGVFLGESFQSLNERVKQHICNNFKKSNDDEDQCIWIITHGIILTNIYHNLSKKYFHLTELPHRPDALSYIYFIRSERENLKELNYDL
jgi:broad specificity phosphatase PhoE